MSVTTTLSKEGNVNAARNKSSSGVANLLDPVKGCRDAMRRRGLKPKNHHAANLAKMRELQQVNREKKNTPAPAAKQNRLTRRAKSKFLEEAEKKGSDAKKKHTFLRRGNPGGGGSEATSACGSASATARKPHSSLPKPRQPVLPKKPSVPRRQDVNKLKPRNESKDYVSANKSGAKLGHKPVTEEKKQDFRKKKTYGRVPEYLLNRKIELIEAAAAKKRAEEEQAVPEGMRQMSEAERRTTLQMLQTNAKKVEEALGKLPLTVEGPSMIKREKELRKKLKEIEDALKIFNKPKVFIQIEE